MPSLIKRFAKHLYEIYFSEEEEFSNQFQNNSQKNQKTIELIYGEAVSILGYKKLSKQINSIQTQQYNIRNFVTSMIVKTFSRLYFFAFLTFFCIYISYPHLSVSDKIEVGIAVFFPFLLTFGVLSCREMYFENRRA